MNGVYRWKIILDQRSISLIPGPLLTKKTIRDAKVHGANMGPIWGRQDPGGPHVGPLNFAIWDGIGYVELE